MKIRQESSVQSKSKPCSKCGDTKPFDLFYKDNANKDKLTCRCRNCISLCQKSYKPSDKSKAAKRIYQKAYDQNPKRKAVKSAYNQEPERKAVNKAYHKTYIETYRETDQYRASKKKYADSNPIKIGAQQASQRAVRSGKLAKPDDCLSCGIITTRLEGHHDDYSKPLDVRWLCPQCHADWHKENGPGINGEGK